MFDMCNSIDARFDLEPVVAKNICTQLPLLIFQNENDTVCNGLEKLIAQGALSFGSDIAKYDRIRHLGVSFPDLCVFNP